MMVEDAQGGRSEIDGERDLQLTLEEGYHPIPVSAPRPGLECLGEAVAASYVLASFRLDGEVSRGCEMKERTCGMVS